MYVCVQSETEVLLVPITSSNQWQSTESLDVLSLSPPEHTQQPEHTSPAVQRKSLTLKPMQHNVVPSFRKSSKPEEKPISELSSLSSTPPVSTMSPVLKKVSLISQKNSTFPSAYMKRATSAPVCILITIIRLDLLCTLYAIYSYSYRVTFSYA